MVEGLVQNGTISSEDQLRLHVKLQTEAITRMNETVQRQARMINSLLIVILGMLIVLMALVSWFTL